MSQGSLLHLDLQTNRITAYRGPNSFAYSGIVAGTDGNLYLADFGNNRIVRINPVTLNEVAWQELNPNFGRTELSQPTLDGAGHVFVAEEISGGAIARLDLSTGEWDRFGNGFLLDPTHFFLQGNFVYAVETDPSGGDGRFVVMDLSTVAFATISSSPVLNNLSSLPLASAIVRTFITGSRSRADKPPAGENRSRRPTPGSMPSELSCRRARPFRCSDRRQGRSGVRAPCLVQAFPRGIWTSCAARAFNAASSNKRVPGFF
jgi:hypothetical protein